MHFHFAIMRNALRIEVQRQTVSRRFNPRFRGRTAIEEMRQELESLGWTVLTNV